SGPGTVLLTAGSLRFIGTQTFDNASISIGAATGRYGCNLSHAGTAGTLTLGTGVTITQVGRYASGLPIQNPGTYVATGTIANQGSINAWINGGLLRIGAGAFSNHGIVSVS